MNKFIKEQLNKCTYANIPDFDDNSTVIYIPKTKPGSASNLRVGRYYLIEIADYVFSSAEMSTLSSNWNNGTTPPCKYMNVEVENIVGRMYRVNGTGYDPATQSVLMATWSGWLPGQAINVVEEV